MLRLRAGSCKRVRQHVASRSIVKRRSIALEPVGIYATIKISKRQVDKFFVENSDALIDDVRYILGQKGSRDKYGLYVNPETHYHHHPRNQLVIQYEETSEILFYFYMLELRNAEAMGEVPSFKAFTAIAAYKDGDRDDYIAFSSSAPNFLTDPLWRALEVGRGVLVGIEANRVPADRMKEIDALSWRYYWGPIEAMFQRMDRGEDISYFDRFFPDHCFYPTLLERLGIVPPAPESRFEPAPYPERRRSLP